MSTCATNTTVIFERLAGHLHGKEFYPARHGIVEMLVKIHGFRGCEMRFFLDYTPVFPSTSTIAPSALCRPSGHFVISATTFMPVFAP